MSEVPPGDPRARYRRDSVFRNLVDNFRALIHRADCTPSEMREALTLAAIMESERHPGKYEWVPAIDPREKVAATLLADGLITPRDALTSEVRAELDALTGGQKAPQ